jgi:polar amino acid transport system substrate-binding protein
MGFTIAGRHRLGRAGSAVLLSLIAAISIAVSAQTKQLRLVSTAWPPFTNQSGEPRFALDLVEAGLARAGVTASTTIVDAARYTPALLKGEFDGSAAAWKDPERERALLYSQPYLENRLILVGRRGDSVSATTLAGLKGKRLAIVEGYSYGEIENSGPTFVRSRSEEDSLALLLKSAVDYTLMDELVVHYIVLNYPEEAKSRLQIGSTPLITRPLYVVVRRTLPDAELIVNRFNAQLRGMIADRTYNRLLHMDWISADIDGDGRLEYVPQSDRPGRVQPQGAYTLFSSGKPSPQPAPPASQQRFFFGGTVYDSWSAVPDRYKVDDPLHKDPGKSVVPIFRFTF